MSISTQSPKVAAPSAQPRRLWRVPRSKVWWISLLAAMLLDGLILFYFVKTGGLGDKPGTGSLPRFGIIALSCCPSRWLTHCGDASSARCPAKHRTGYGYTTGRALLSC